MRSALIASRNSSRPNRGLRLRVDAELRDVSTGSPTKLTSRFRHPAVLRSKSHERTLRKNVPQPGKLHDVVIKRALESSVLIVDLAVDVFTVGSAITLAASS